MALGVILSFVNNFTQKSDITKKNYNVYLETFGGSGTYLPSSSSIFPTSGYTFNAEKSKCQNGTVLSYNNETKTINLITDKTDFCNVYFDKIKIPMSPYIQSLAGTTQGVTAEAGTSKEASTRR